MFELATPWVLWFLPLPWVIWYGMSCLPPRWTAALRVPFFNDVARVVQDNERVLARRMQGMPLLFLVVSLLIGALSGPRWVGEPQPLTRDGYNIMLALDLSGSMELNDMLLQGHLTSRLAVVKEAAKQFVVDRVGDRIGLILFGSEAYLQTPLTYDHASVLMRIDDATVGLAGKTTSIGDALGLAVKRLQNVPAEGRLIILLTDGVNNSGVLAPLKAAELARADGIKIYTIGLGSELDPSQFGSLFFDMNTTADLDETTLKQVAKITGGRYFRATNMASLQAIYQHINQMEAPTQEQAMVRPQHDYYLWPLMLAWCLFLYWLGNVSGIFAGWSQAGRQRESM